MREEGYDLEAGGTSRWMGFNLTQDPSNMIIGSLQKSLFDAGALFAIDSTLYSSCMDAIRTALNEASDNTEPGTILSVLVETEVSAERIGDIMQNVAKALNLILRSNGKAGFSDPALGTVNEYAVCVQVSWVWFTFPAILGASAVFILVFTIIDTIQNDLPVWKSFPLATLFNGPGMEWVDRSFMTEPSETDLEGVGTQDGMEKLAKKVSPPKALQPSSAVGDVVPPAPEITFAKSRRVVTASTNLWQDPGSVNACESPAPTRPSVTYQETGSEIEDISSDSVPGSNNVDAPTIITGHLNESSACSPPTPTIVADDRRIISLGWFPSDELHPIETMKEVLKMPHRDLKSLWSMHPELHDSVSRRLEDSKSTLHICSLMPSKFGTTFQRSDYGLSIRLLVDRIAGICACDFEAWDAQMDIKSKDSTNELTLFKNNTNCGREDLAKMEDKE
ncbi:hypothetical protein N0V82_005923 [Gnomoniopsis sp. IMI 355080]|nr:hypothetical protein N0V82_005923 [Gnomoniopsis sp. IMI 355080]